MSHMSRSICDIIKMYSNQLQALLIYRALARTRNFKEDFYVKKSKAGGAAGL